MKNLLIMQENEFSGTISIYPSTMQPLCRPTHVDKLVTSNFQICFPAPYLSLHAKYSLCRTCPKAELDIPKYTGMSPKSTRFLRQLVDRF